MSAPKKTGRPSTYDDQIAERICAELAAGNSLRAICSSPGMPGRETVFRWLREHEAFRDQYARAKAESVHAIAEEILEIADNTAGDYDEEGRFRPENVQRARLRIDARKWILSKLAPRQYGNRLDLNHGGQEDNPLRALVMAAQGTAIRPVPTHELRAIDMVPTGDESEEG